jgi:hypothetical protein
VAHEGTQAQATSLVTIGSGLLGPASGPVIVGVVGDAVTAAPAPNSLGPGLPAGPDRKRPDRLRPAQTSLALPIASRRIAALREVG